MPSDKTLGQRVTPLPVAVSTGPLTNFDRRPGDRHADQPTLLFERSRKASAPGVSAAHFGDYELLEEIGRGGMGIVYRAQQISLNRTVALKMILAGHLASEEEVRRFHAEAEAAASLDHPGIVPIYEVGQREGQHFFSMSYIGGRSLATIVSAGPLPVREAARLTRCIAESVAYAHSRGVIHRDLKPANVLQGDDGQPRITDFGLAKRVDGDRHLTTAGQILGTPSYMAPEQASGLTNQIGPGSDIYSIGAILYELVTGRPPFMAATPLETLRQAVETDPAPPRLLNPKVPCDLETVCLKCLLKDPALRYGTARELSEDLERFLAGEPIRARSINLLQRVTRALSSSRYEEQFQDWGITLMAMGAVIFLTHASMFLMTSAGVEEGTAYWIPRLVMGIALLALIWRARPHSLLPTSAAERPIWAVWIGYMIAIAANYVIVSVDGRRQFELYPTSAVLSGLGFFATAGQSWGGCYVIGLAFMAAAPFLILAGPSAAVWFGGLWLLALVTLGSRYRRLGRGNRSLL